MVEYLEIFDEQHPVRISYYVMKQVKQEHGKTFQEALQEAEETGDIEVHETILYAALQMGKYAQEKEMEIDFDREEMGMVLDLVWFDYLELFESETFFPKKLREMAERQNQANNGSEKPQRKKKAKTEN